MDSCRGVFGPCGRLATHKFVAPEGEIPLCKEHWEWSEDLVKDLMKDPELFKKFQAAVEDAVDAEKRGLN